MGDQNNTPEAEKQVAAPIAIPQVNKTSRKIENAFKIAGIIISIIALTFSAWQYNAGRKREDKSNRPFLTVKNYTFSYDSDSTGLPIFSSSGYIIFNAGVHVAEQIFVNTIILDSVTGKIIMQNDGFSLANPIAKNIEFTYFPIPVMPNDRNYIYKTIFRYNDALSNENYKDSIYLNWISGVTKKNDKYEANNGVRGLTIQEAIRCDSLIKVNLK